jgi:glycerol kinase
MRRKIVAAIDQGTQSTRVVIYEGESGKVLGWSQRAVRQRHERAGWASQCAEDMASSVQLAGKDALAMALHECGVTGVDCVGLTNQRETTVAWCRRSGKPLSEAVLWLDTRSASVAQSMTRRFGGDVNAFRGECGLPFSAYFSATKMRWMLDNLPAVREAADNGTLAFGTVDSWLMYVLSGGDVHATDVTNASRTMLMDLHTCAWSERLCDAFGVPLDALPAIHASAHRFGRVQGGALGDAAYDGAPISGVIGDQQAALVGQRCFERGDAKNTYGTGCFLLMNTGSAAERCAPVVSRSGLLTTVAYQLGDDEPPCYALEGSIAIAGAGLSWLRDNLGLVGSPVEAAELAASVDDTGDLYFVPAFSGLFAPYWRADARGCIVGLSQYSTRAHLVRAMFESVAFQTSEILRAMTRDAAEANLQLRRLNVDGGMAQSDMLLQFQADILNLDVCRPANVEATAMGAAIVALLGAGVYARAADVPEWSPSSRFAPSLDDESRQHKLSAWNKAVVRSFNWVDETGSISNED